MAGQKQWHTPNSCVNGIGERRGPSLVSLPVALLGLAAIVGAIFPDLAEAACFNVTRGISITGSTAADGQPTAGETVSCDANAPNPFPFGVVATTGQSNINVTNGTGSVITAPGSGILLNDSATIVNDGAVITTSLNGFGLSKQFFGTITNNGTVETSGQTAHGIRSLGGFGVVTNTGTVSVSGLNAYGILAGVNETVVNSGLISASGDGGNGIFMLGGTQVTNTETGVITSTLATGIQGSGSNFTVRNAGVILGGNGTAINLPGGTNLIEVTGGAITGDVVTGAGVDTLNWSGGGTIAGAIRLNDGNDVANLENLQPAILQPTTLTDGGLGTDTLTLTNVQTSEPERFVNWESIDLRASTQLTMGGDLTLGDLATQTGTLTIDHTSTLTASGGSYSIAPSVSGAAVDVDNSGMIDLAAASSSVGDRLTILGNYTGLDGELRLNTTLGDDSSPTDMLLVTGNTAGRTLVDVVNVNGGGALTSDGIKIISVDGFSDGTFALLGDYEFEGQPAVVGGAYAYRLYKGGASTPNDGDWYLRSVLNPSDPDIEQEIPLYQAGVPVYEAYPQLLLGLNGLPTLEQRVGNRYWSHAGNVVPPREGAPQERNIFIEDSGIWGRVEGAHSRFSPRFSTSGADYDINSFRFQAGLDGLFIENDNGRLIGALTAHYLHGKAKTDSIYGDGEISTDGYGIGGTLTWYGENGVYVDGQAQGTWYDSDLNSTLANLGLTNGNNGFGYALSLEGGQHLVLDQQLSVTPQAQLVYSNVDFDSFHDTFEARVGLDQGNSLQGRIGVSIDRQNAWQNDKGMIDRSYVYGIANLYYEFLDGTKVEVSDMSFASRNDRFWGGIGLGASYNWDSDRYSLYGEASINTSLANLSDSYAYKGTVGFRVRW
ncbi:MULTISPECIES: autotransporter outer membrane beta-barrel domain-containing protein [unclassified Rhizobium]|uniref:autotransporter family protein n=1 Tax=unclassified Rhizobium TaxID=2613769 RepID=UPI00161E69E5|nr:MULTISPECIES: autotransporter outer membrane beta-barrel domain-containing protein [unclassified Rhizobium]MBB3545344.1 outer membrane autotransporter protein [Rhizobium sp. BK399]MCS4096756.1 outer membrane autotransporter protein [Rhizobium sp. BK176]